MHATFWWCLGPVWSVPSIPVDLTDLIHCQHLFYQKWATGTWILRYRYFSRSPKIVQIALDKFTGDVEKKLPNAAMEVSLNIWISLNFEILLLISMCFLIIRSWWNYRYWLKVTWHEKSCKSTGNTTLDKISLPVKKLKTLKRSKNKYAHSQNVHQYWATPNTKVVNITRSSVH